VLGARGKGQGTRRVRLATGLLRWSFGVRRRLATFSRSQYASCHRLSRTSSCRRLRLTITAHCPLPTAHCPLPTAHCRPTLLSPL